MTNSTQEKSFTVVFNMKQMALLAKIIGFISCREKLDAISVHTRIQRTTTCLVGRFSFSTFS